jgi:hypothetical protein
MRLALCVAAAGLVAVSQKTVFRVHAAVVVRDRLAIIQELTATPEVDKVCLGWVERDIS